MLCFRWQESRLEKIWFLVIIYRCENLISCPIMTTSTGSLLEGVDNDVFFAFIALIIITVLTAIYFLNVNGGITSLLSGSWVYLTTTIQRQSAGIQSGRNERPSPSGTDSRVAESTADTTESRNEASPSCEQSQAASKSHVENSPSSGQAEGHFTEGLTQRTGLGPGSSEDKEQPSGVGLNQEGISNTQPSETQETHGEGLRHRTGCSAEPSHSQNDETSAPQVSLRVKHHEVERNFVVDANITVGELKRLSFPDEVAQGRRVRFVYSGRLLHDDNANLTFYGITNYSVIHAQISDITEQSSPLGQHEDDIEIDISRLFIPLLTFILCGCWYGLITYRQLFNATSTAILLVVTAAYGFMVYIMFA